MTTTAQTADIGGHNACPECHYGVGHAEDCSHRGEVIAAVAASITAEPEDAEDDEDDDTPADPEAEATICPECEREDGRHQLTCSFIRTLVDGQPAIIDDEPANTRERVLLRVDDHEMLRTIAIKRDEIKMQQDAVDREKRKLKARKDELDEILGNVTDRIKDDGQVEMFADGNGGQTTRATLCASTSPDGLRCTAPPNHTGTRHMARGHANEMLGEWDKTPEELEAMQSASLGIAKESPYPASDNPAEEEVPFTAEPEPIKDEVKVDPKAEKDEAKLAQGQSAQQFILDWADRIACNTNRDYVTDRGREGAPPISWVMALYREHVGLAKFDPAVASPEVTKFLGTAAARKMAVTWAHGKVPAWLV